MLFQKYDVIVVGGVHAGSEAAAAAANLGAQTLLVTMSLQNIAQMSCNPAMGGIAKGQILREIDALGGQSAIITDKTAIQFKMLNKSKGPAMWSPRAQSDRMRFAEAWRLTLEHTENLDLYQDAVNGLLFEGDKIIALGVNGENVILYKDRSVWLTIGFIVTILAGLALTAIPLLQAIGVVSFNYGELPGSNWEAEIPSHSVESIQKYVGPASMLITGLILLVNAAVLNFLSVRVQVTKNNE